MGHVSYKHKTITGLLGSDWDESRCVGVIMIWGGGGGGMGRYF